MLYKILAYSPYPPVTILPQLFESLVLLFQMSKSQADPLSHQWSPLCLLPALMIASLLSTFNKSFKAVILPVGPAVRIFYIIYWAHWGIC